MTPDQITDDMLRAGVRMNGLDRIQGFATPLDERRSRWGAPYYIRDVFRPPGKQEIWRGDSQDELHERCEMERLRLQLSAVLGHQQTQPQEKT